MLRKSLLYGLCLVTVTLGLSGCEEEQLTPDYEYRLDTFKPAPDAQDSTSILRREFYDSTGSYLLFNDTLQHEFLGYDYNDEPVWFTEVLDITYELGTSTGSRDTYKYTLITEYAEQKKATQFLKDYILIHFSKTLKLFSWFLAYDIVGEPVGSINGTLVYPDAVYGQRCVAIACDYILKNEGEDQKELYANRVINVFINELVSLHSDKFSEFRAISKDYYGGTFSSTSNSENTRYLREAGFLVSGKNGSGNPVNGYYPTFIEDLSSYATYVLNLDEATMESAYGQYPLVMQKYRLFRDTLIELGFIF